MDHYSDDDLADYVVDPSSVSEHEAIESHLESCADCRARVAALEETEEILRDPEVWQQVDGLLARPSRIEEARKARLAIERENAEAVRMLAPLLASPLRFSDAQIAANPRFRTEGVVRMLCAEANGMHEKRPKFSLQLAEAACAIGEALGTSGARYCRGLALRERANALRYLGRFTEALKSLEIAESMFDGSPGADPFDRAIVGYIRGTVLVQMERAGEALAVARSVVQVFRDYGDQHRELTALLLEGACLHTLGLHVEAAPLFEHVIALSETLRESELLAYATQAAAVTAVDLGQLDVAERHYVRALVLYDQLGVPTERARIDWAIGSLAMARGQLKDAERILNSARIELQSLGLRNDHALATLEWAEVRLALDQTTGVASACREILLQFDSEGMMRNARLALVHLRQALEQKTATPELVRRIRTYLKDLPQHPTSPFASA